MIENRHVFYIGGFDPRGPLFTYQNCVEETKKWSSLTGHVITVAERGGDGDVADIWTIESDLGDARVKTTFHCLRWDDIVRRNWEKDPWRVAFRVLRLAFPVYRSGVFNRARDESWPFTVTMATAALPAALVVACTMLVMLALVVAVLGSGLMWKLPSLLPLGAAAWLAWWGKQNIHRFSPDWTGRTGIFIWELATGPRYEKFHSRLDAMAHYVAGVVEREKPDEAQIIGHSLGTILAALITARLLGRRPQLASGLTLITLGQLCSFIRDVPAAQWFRDELSVFANHHGFTWLDFSSPPDGACYALVNTLDFLPDPPDNLPRLLNAQFHKTFSVERIAEARLRRIEMHFLYLKSPDYPQPDTDLYDYVTLITGPVSAAQRFGERTSGTAFFRKTASA